MIGANEHGLIAISRREFEVGSTFALGLHVSLPDARQSEFVSAETIVVACQPEVDLDGRAVFRVALLFSEISWSDRDLLELVAHDEGLLSSPSERRRERARRKSGPGELLDLVAGKRLGEAIDSVCLN